MSPINLHFLSLGLSIEQSADNDLAQMLVQRIFSNEGNAAAAGHYSVFPNLAP